MIWVRTDLFEQVTTQHCLEHKSLVVSAWAVKVGFKNIVFRFLKPKNLKKCVFKVFKGFLKLKTSGQKSEF